MMAGEGSVGKGSQRQGKRWPWLIYKGKYSREELEEEGGSSLNKLSQCLSIIPSPVHSQLGIYASRRCFNSGRGLENFASCTYILRFKKERGGREGGRETGKERLKSLD
jgi:hypothetical protein